MVALFIYHSIFRRVQVNHQNLLNSTGGLRMLATKISQPPVDTAADVAEHLQWIFTKPWQGIVSMKIPDISEIGYLLKKTNPPLPSVRLYLDN